MFRFLNFFDNCYICSELGLKMTSVFRNCATISCSVSCQGGYCHNLIGNILEDSLCIVPYVKRKMQGLSVYMPE